MKLELYSYDLYRSDRLKLWASWSIDILTGRCTAYIVMIYIAVTSVAVAYILRASSADSIIVIA